MTETKLFKCNYNLGFIIFPLNYALAGQLNMQAVETPANNAGVEVLNTKRTHAYKPLHTT